MQITFKAAGRLKSLLDDETVESGVLKLPDSCSLAELLQNLAVPDDEPFVFIVNNTMVPESAFASTLLHEGDEIILMPPIRGG